MNIRILAALIILAWALVFCLSTRSASGQERAELEINCFPPTLRWKLRANGLAPFVQGLTPSEQVVEVWRDAQFLRWAITIRTADGRFCILGGGNHIETLIWFIPKPEF